jgi:hypothetical protein
LNMDSSDTSPVRRLYQKMVPAWFFRELCRQHGYGFRQGVYSAAVVVWLMIWQRLEGNRSLAAAVQYLVQGDAGDLQTDCKRWTEEKVSAATGSYCEARQRLPIRLVREVTERMVAGLRAEMQEGWKGLQRPVFVIDGSSLRLPHNGTGQGIFSRPQPAWGESLAGDSDSRFPRRFQRIGFAAELGADVRRPARERAGAGGGSAGKITSPKRWFRVTVISEFSLSHTQPSRVGDR